MLAITVSDEFDQRQLRPSAEELAAMVHRIGGPDDHYLLLLRVPDRPQVYAQVWHEDGGDYELEHRDGGPDRHFQVRLADPEAVAAALTAWARQEERWDAGLTWERLDFGTPAPVPPLDLSAEERELLETDLRALLAGGYTSRTRLAEAAEECLASDDRRPVSPDQARELADRLWLERLAEQESWPGETDPDRLSRAFVSLDAAGITARENFTCCRSCGQAEIGGEAGEGSRGFVYFHMQSTDAAAAGQALTLYYGGFDGSAETTAAVGREVRAALEAEGLPVVWNGDPDRALKVTPVDWRKRLT